LRKHPAELLGYECRCSVELASVELAFVVYLQLIDLVVFHVVYLIGSDLSLVDIDAVCIDGMCSEIVSIYLASYPAYGQLHQSSNRILELNM